MTESWWFGKPQGPIRVLTLANLPDLPPLDDDLLQKLEAVVPEAWPGGPNIITLTWPFMAPEDMRAKLKARGWHPGEPVRFTNQEQA